jgi:hypothetical protein
VEGVVTAVDGVENVAALFEPPDKYGPERSVILGEQDPHVS